MARGGKREGSGRKKGVPNKLTGDVKAMILEALENKGGVSYLEKQADANPVAFMTLVGKVLPLTVQGDPEQPLSIVIASGVPRMPVEDDHQANGHPHPSH